MQLVNEVGMLDSLQKTYPNMFVAPLKCTRTVKRIEHLFNVKVKAEFDFVGVDLFCFLKCLRQCFSDPEFFGDFCSAEKHTFVTDLAACVINSLLSALSKLHEIGITH